MAQFVTLFLIGVGLSMDAFAVSICKGLAMRNKVSVGQAAVIALFFGGFQALMPAVGWLLGKQFEQYITSIDHWIAFGLLAFIGGHMLWEVWKGEGEEDENEEAGPLRLGELTLLAIATSIDALAVGVSMAFMSVHILASAAVIGVVAFALSVAGGLVGRRLGCLFQRRAELTGGLVLIAIGVKILIEHLSGS